MTLPTLSVNSLFSSLQFFFKSSKKREKASNLERESCEKMSKSAGLLVICAVIVVAHMIALSFPAVEAASSGGDHNLGWIPTTTSTVGGSSACRGSMAECLSEGGDLDLDDMEFAMDSESHRRILANSRRYISYGALSRNNVPCSRRGASYYNCRSGGQANPYSRGCSAITRCRR